MPNWLKAILDQLVSRSNSRSTPPIVRETSTLRSILEHCPNAERLLDRRYGHRLTENDQRRSLGEFVRLNGLPPAQILFMEIQLDARESKVKSISAREAKRLLASGEVRIFDVREGWERKHGTLPGAIALDQTQLDQLIGSTDRGLPLLFYCHFGVRSMDAASYFAEQGFKNVHCMTGGIDAWAQEVDTTIPRYYENPC